MSVFGGFAMGMLRAFSVLVPHGSASAQEELDKAREYNKKHPFHKLRDHRAIYRYAKIAGYPCILIRSRKTENVKGKAILYLHGGVKNEWEAELMVARGYADHTGLDVWYPVYPSVTEMTDEKIKRILIDVYKAVIKKYGADKTILIGTSFGGTFGFALISRINELRKAGVETISMPALFIANSPGWIPDTGEDWKELEKFSRKDPLIKISDIKNIIEMQKLVKGEDGELSPADFSDAPETYVYYAEETLAGNHLAFERGYRNAGVSNRLHVHIEPRMMHGYSCMPVFKESKKAYYEQIKLIRRV